jgi:L-ornithine N5-oxygenase
MRKPDGKDRPVADLISIGCGPAGLALASAMFDWEEARPDRPEMVVEFLESRGDSSWQPAQLLPGTTLQHHFFRDFATPRNPRSRFTFANFLWEKGRLFDFGLMEGPVLRSEWNEYVKWVAAGLYSCITYNTLVQEVQPHQTAGMVNLLRVKTAEGERLARNIVVNTGHPPRIPDEYRPLLCDRFFHSSRFLPAIAPLDQQAAMTFLVVGSGQSAAEVVSYLYDRFPQSSIHSVHRKGAFALLDHGQFGHKIYSPEETDYFYCLSAEKREEEYRQVFLTNYSGVDWPTSTHLYRKYYEDKVRGHERIFIYDRCVIRKVEKADCLYRVTAADKYTDKRFELNADVVILCTGFYEEVFPRVLEPLRPYIRIDEQGGPAVTRDYRVETKGDFEPLIYLNGLCERTHGMSDANSFSMMALKADRILRSWLDLSNNPKFNDPKLRVAVTVDAGEREESLT